LVTHKYGEFLYEKVKLSIQGISKELCKKISDQDNSTFLAYLLQKWKQFKDSISMVRDILLYLDENYVEKKSHDSKILSVYDNGVYIFQEFIISENANRIQRLMLEIILKERNGEMNMDRFLLKNLSQMLVEIEKEKVYIGIFENKFLQETHTYYKNEAQEYFDASTAPIFLEKVRIRLKEEVQRAEKCLDYDTNQKVQDVVKEELIDNYKELLINKTNSGLLTMLKNDKRAELRLVFEVLGLVKDALNPTIKTLKEYCLNEGLSIVKDEKNDKDPFKLIQEIIEFRVRYDKLLLESFSTKTKDVTIRDKDFSKAIKDVNK
jgi:cullin 3